MWCSDCNRYLQPPKYWVECDLESRELLTICLKRIRGLSKVRLVDASFIWTEPHSRRLKVKLTIQKEVFNGTILQQSFVVDFVVITNMCEACRKLQTVHHWVASVQVRQKVDHKRTFLFLEQLILKHNVHKNAINIKDEPDGLDFFFNHKSHALKFIEFLKSVAPVTSKSSDQLISADLKSNTYNYKYSFAAEIAPICREDLVCLPKNLSTSFGGIGPLVLCVKVNSSLHFLDPTTLETAELMGQLFWKQPFSSMAVAKQLVEFTVIDVEPLNVFRGKFQLAEAQVVRSEDLGKTNGAVIYVKTHLGKFLKPGDVVLGYDLIHGNFNDYNWDSLKASARQDVILVRKHFARQEQRKRKWQLRALQKEESEITKKGDEIKKQKDLNRFMEELEEDPELRAQINLYKSSDYNANDDDNDMRDEGEEDEDGTPRVDVDELLDLDAMNIDGEDDEDGEDEDDEDYDDEDEDM
eukprot:GEZU01024280.1.p1 GENE.GEZU01024280.1~~GEZU01024280.1.p1  ORF type:complete len:534 (-),score=181.42 GEZU01024280.1:191-1594(-)